MAEHHARHSQYLEDFVLGFADGLTVPFALTAGLSSLGSPKLVVIGGLAELFSGSISMGLGAYLAAITGRDHYEAELIRERNEVRDVPDVEKKEIYQILCSYGPSYEQAQPFVDALCKNEEQWLQFMMDFELKLEKPGRRQAYISALVMGLAYFIGGLLPMIPYFATRTTTTALFISIGITTFILIAFGFLKARMLGCTTFQSARSAVITLGIGAVAAGSSYGIVRALNGANFVS